MLPRSRSGGALSSRPPTDQIRVLRPAGPAQLVSAQVFDELFGRDLHPHVDVQTVDLDTWLDGALGPSDAEASSSVEALRASTVGVDFLCPDHHGLAFVPRLLTTRNHGGLAVRVLIIAHSPGAFLFEWALMRPLLRPGDRIIAPSTSAADMIEWVCPELSPWVRVVPHPMRPLPDPGRSRAPTHLSCLGRLVPSKLVHRVLEALRILHDRGRSDLRLVLAGPDTEPGEPVRSSYVRGLEHMVERLGLAEHVRFPGVVTQAEAKAALLFDSHMLINLSVSAEESFGKSIVEAQGLGVPVLTTRWNGLTETLGDGGRALAVRSRRFGMDVDAVDIADGIAGLLHDPPTPETCRASASRFHPDSIGPRYRELLEQALHERGEAVPCSSVAADEPAAPNHGLLADNALLHVYSWHELMQLQGEELDALRHRWSPPDRGTLSRSAQVRSCVFLGARRAIEHALAGLPTESLCERTGTDRVRPETDEFEARLATAAAGTGTRSARVVCLNVLASLGRTHELQIGLEHLRTEGLRSPGTDFLETEALLLSQQPCRAVPRMLEDDDPESWSDQAAHRLIQLGRAAVAARASRRAWPVLVRWTDQYPDAPGAGSVWLYRCIMATMLSNPDDAQLAHRKARALLGDRPELRALARMVDLISKGAA